MGKRRRLAYFSAQPLAPADSGARIRNAELLRGLVEHGEVVVFFDAFTPDELRGELEIGGVRVSAHGAIRDLSYSGPGGVAEKWRRDADPPQDDPLVVAVRREAERQPFDLAVVEQVFSTGVARHAGAPIVLDEHNVESATWLTNLIRQGVPEGEAKSAVEPLTALERAAWCEAKLVTACTRADADVLGAVRKDRVEVVSNGVDLDAITFVPPSKREGREILFVGSFFWPPNFEAASFLARDVLPRVKRYWPDARLTLCGHDPSGDAKNLLRPGVQVTGRVESVAPFLSRATVYANGLRTGGGSSMKTVEALASGLPLVSTGVGARGFDVGGAYLPAENASEFAEAICAVFADRAAFDELARFGRDACRPYDWKHLAGRFASLVSSVGREQGVSEMASSVRLAPSALEGMQPLILVSPSGEPHDERARILADGLRRRGADVQVSTTAEATSIDELMLETRDALPSIVFCVGPHEAFGLLGMATGLPVVHLASGADPTVSRFPEGGGDPRSRREILLEIAESGKASLRAPFPVLALEPLEETHDASIESIAALLCGLADAVLTTDAPPPAALCVTEPEFLDYLASFGPKGTWSTEELGRLVRQCKKLGVPFWTTAEGDVFHRARSWQWIWDNSPLFYERQRRAGRPAKERVGYVVEKRGPSVCCDRRATEDERRVLARPIRYRIKTWVDVRLEKDDAGKTFRVFLPTPISTEEQRDIVFVNARPRAMRDAIVPEWGYVYGFDLKGEELAEGRVFVECDLTVHEVHVHGRPVRFEPAPYDLSAPRLVEHLKNANLDAYVKAWTVHDWMCQNGAYKKTMNACLCKACAGKDFDRDRTGHCLLWAHAFQAYCEALGLRTRAVAGIPLVLARDTSGKRFGYELPGERVVAHEWAEVEIPELGFLPVEFHQYNTTTFRNCQDKATAKRFAEDDRFSRDFAFGNLDNLHIRYPLGNARAPTVLRHCPERPANERWAPMDERNMRFGIEGTILTEFEP